EPVDAHVATRIDLDRGAGQVEPVGQGPSTDRHHDGVDCDRVTAEVHGRAVPARLVAVDLDAGAHLYAPTLERSGDHVDDVVVTTRQQLRQDLEQGDLHAEVAHHRCELAADGAAADDDGRGRQRVEVEHLVGGHHDAPVDVEAGKRSRHRSRREEHV